jgi:type IV pilus assembly protein PilP
MRTTIIACVYLGLLTACSRSTDDVTLFVEEQPAGRVEPLPEIKPAESFAYNAYELRSPFMPSSASDQPDLGSRGPRPDPNRSREPLEQYSLDTLKMLGTLRFGDQIICGLLETPDGLVHRVTIGSHLGQAGGVVTNITAEKISILEIVADSLGGYMERHAALELNNRHASLLRPLKR